MDNHYKPQVVPIDYKLPGNQTVVPNLEVPDNHTKIQGLCAFKLVNSKRMSLSRPPPPANKVWGKVIFTQAPVILSGGGGGFPACITCYMTGGLHPKEGVCIGGRGSAPGGGASRECLPTWGEGGGQTPPLRYIGYGQQAGGTHPTGSLSCSFSIFVVLRRSDMNAQRRLGYDSDASDRSNRSSRQQQSRISGITHCTLDITISQQNYNFLWQVSCVVYFSF